jgi:hypothetical protein
MHCVSVVFTTGSESLTRSCCLIRMASDGWWADIPVEELAPADTKRRRAAGSRLGLQRLGRHAPVPRRVRRRPALAIGRAADLVVDLSALPQGTTPTLWTTDGDGTTCRSGWVTPAIGLHRPVTSADYLGSDASAAGLLFGRSPAHDRPAWSRIPSVVPTPQGPGRDCHGVDRGRPAPVGVPPARP